MFGQPRIIYQDNPAFTKLQERFNEAVRKRRQLPQIPQPMYVEPKVEPKVPPVSPEPEPVVKPKAKPRQKLPAAVRRIVWSTYIGSEVSSGKCFCCNFETITVSNFECGHIISHKDGGDTTIQNLRPICSFCNRSIGKRNMEEFMCQYGIKKREMAGNEKISLINAL